MTSSIPHQNSKIIITKSPNQAFSCSSSGYSSQSLSECDTNSNKNHQQVSKSSLGTLSSNSTPSSSQSGIDRINPSILLLESSNSLSCIRTSTPTNPINSTTLDNNSNNNTNYKSISSECCYSDTLSSHYSSNPSGSKQHQQQMPSLISPISQNSIDYFRQISFNPTCNSSSLYQQQSASNYYFVNNVKCFGEPVNQQQQLPSYSFISPIGSLVNKKVKKKSNTSSFISTSTKTSSSAQTQLFKQQAHVNVNMINNNNNSQFKREPHIKNEIRIEKKPSKISIFFTFFIKLINCFNVFSYFTTKKHTETQSTTESPLPSSQLTTSENNNNVFTSSTSLKLSSDSTSSIPKILLKNKKNSFMTKKDTVKSIESPTSFNFVGFANNCVSSTPIQLQQPKPINARCQNNNNNRPVVEIKSKSLLNHAAIESQLQSPFYMKPTQTNTNKNTPSEYIPNKFKEEKETYDNLPPEVNVLNLKSSNFMIPYPKYGMEENGLEEEEEVEHYVKINTLNFKSSFKSPVVVDITTDSTNSTNYENDLAQIAKREMFTTSSPTSIMSSSSSLANSVNIYLTNNVLSSSNSASSSSSSSSSLTCSLQKHNSELVSNIRLKPVKISDFVVNKVVPLNTQNYLYLNRQHGTNYFKQNRFLVNKHTGSGPVPIYDDYLCDKEVESYFDNPDYINCYKQNKKIYQASQSFNNYSNRTKQLMINKRLSNGVLQNKQGFSSFVNNNHHHYNHHHHNQNENKKFPIKIQESRKTGIIGPGIIRQQTNGESYC